MKVKKVFTLTRVKYIRRGCAEREEPISSKGSTDCLMQQPASSQPQKQVGGSEGQKAP